MLPRSLVAGKIHSGTLVILVIVFAALAASGFAWWHQYQQSRRALAYWGAGGATLIRRGEIVELIELGPRSPDDGAATETLFERTIQGRFDISAAPGLVHSRQSLISDASFQWDAETDAAPAWEYVLRFRDEHEEFLVALDLTAGYAWSPGDRPPLRLGPTLQKGLQRFFAEQSQRRTQ
ncbi:MAG: hypothetical protein KY475_03805 [Planctomycetes bacterium]|nr:hypothetical protein [Planctomycetota bacterium]